MSTKISRVERNESFKRAFVIKVIPFLKEIENKCKLGYNSIDAKNTCDRYEIPTNTVPAMVDLHILSCTGVKRQAKFHWKSSESNFNVLAEKIYDKMIAKTKAAKAEKKLLKNTKSNLVKIIGSKREKEIINPSKDLVLRAMLTTKLIFAENMGGTVIKPEDLIIEAINGETGNEPLSKRITKSLVNKKHVVIFLETAETKLYKWGGIEPNETNAAEILLDMKDDDNTGNKESRIFRIYDFLMFLSTLKNFTEFKMRDKIKEHKLTMNDQVVITSEVLTHEGNKRHRKYKWNGPIIPSLTLAESIYAKCVAYGNKYQNSYRNKNKSTEVNKPAAAIVKNFIGTKTALLSLMDKSGYNKSGYSHHTIIVKAVEDMIKTRDELMVKVNELNAKIEKGKELIKLRESEKEFVDTIIGNHDHNFPTNVTTDMEAYKVSHNKLHGGRKKYSHSQEGILEQLRLHSDRSLEELLAYFYPGKNLTWENKELKSLSSMIHNMKKDGLIVTIGTARYMSFEKFNALPENERPSYKGTLFYKN